MFMYEQWWRHHSSQLIQKAAAMGNWWLAAASSTHSCIMFHAEFFFQNIKSPRWLRLFAAQIWRPVTSGLYQNYNHFWTIRDFRLWRRFRKYYGAADGDWENCVWSQGAYFEGDWGVTVCVQCFLYLLQ